MYSNRAGWIALGISLAVSAAAPLAGETPAPCTIPEIREETAGPTTHLIVSGPEEFAYRSPDAETVIIELPGCLPSFDAATLHLRSPFLTSSRLTTVAGPRPGSELELQLTPGATYRIFEYQGLHIMLETEPTPPPPATPLPLTPPVIAMATSTPAPVPTSAPTATPEIAVAELKPVEVEIATAEPTASSTSTPEPTAVAEATPDATLEAAAAPASKILAIRAERRPGEITITIDTDGAIGRHRDFRVPSPERVAVDLFGLTIAAGVAPPTPPTESVHVRAALFSRSPLITRVVLDLASKLDYHVTVDGSSLSVVVAVPD